MKYPVIFILICLISAFVIGATLVWPKYQDYIDAAQKLENKKNFIANKAEYYNQLEELYAQLLGKEEVLKKVDAVIPNKVEFSSIINYLQTIGEENGLTVKNIDVRNVLNFGKIERVKENHFFVKAVGTYSSFRNFLSKLEKSSRLFGVEQITFTAPKESNGLFDFDMELKVYSY